MKENIQEEKYDPYAGNYGEHRSHQELPNHKSSQAIFCRGVLYSYEVITSQVSHAEGPVTSIKGFRPPVEVVPYTRRQNYPH